MLRIERRQFLKTCAALGAGAAPWGCGTFGPFGAIIEPARDGKFANDDAESINAFGIDLYRQLAATPGNVVASPFSISTALAMTASGAAGATLAEMQKTLHFQDILDAKPHQMSHVEGGFRLLLKDLADAGGVELNIANAVWGDRRVEWKKTYMRTLDTNYGGGFESTDFGNKEKAREQVNRWAAKQTKNKIKEILPDGSIDKGTRMVLANAVYFLGKWANPFEAKATEIEDFHNSGAKPTLVKLMQKTAKFAYHPGDDFQAIELPYRGNKFGMIILLPKDKDGLTAFEQKLTPELFQSISKKLTTETEVSVKLPKFKQESSYSLGETLGKMGIRHAFDGNTADFSGMHTGSDRLYIQKVFHKAMVDVAEEGTEAAAVTAVTMTFGAAPSLLPPIPTFHATHPFLFAIRHRPSGAVLFVGRVENVVEC